MLEESGEFTEAHYSLASEGQTEAANESVNHHFVAFVNFNGELYELDGRKSYPIIHGATDESKFLEVCFSLTKLLYFTIFNKKVVYRQTVTVYILCAVWNA